MAQIDEKVVNNVQAPVETPEAATVEQQNAAPAAAETPEAPANEEPVKEKKEHPKWDAFKAKAKKAAKWVGAGAALVGGLVIANKLGQAKGQAEGFDAACDAFGKATAPDPLPALQELPMEEAAAGFDTEAAVTAACDSLGATDPTITNF